MGLASASLFYFRCMEYKKYGRKIVNAIEGIDNPAYKCELQSFRSCHFTIVSMMGL